MTTEPINDASGKRGVSTARPADAPRGRMSRIGARLLHEVREAVAPILYFLVGFNVIVLTTNLIDAQYHVAVSNFTLATVGALIVGKAVVVVNALPFIRRYDRGPLILPILFKTGVYWVAVFIVRLLERFVHYSIVEGNAAGSFPSHLLHDFSWTHFGAIAIWVLILFLVYETAWEFGRVFGVDEIRQLLFERHPTPRQSTERQ